MMVLKYKCKKCNHVCNVINFQYNFINWTSGNDDIDKFIRSTQLSVHEYYEVSNALEWIPYDRLYNIKCIAKTEKYKANWIDGNLSYWSNYNQNWERENKNMIVELKNLNNFRNITLEFMNEVF
jgi:hypothetical protein